ncbi:ribonuclease H-like domain-containing protein [Dactylonectria estremocensis]|uniref:RNA exonuclease 4 n=1 Tax=Dactylonectria estremocensis TaxID=1079267 RepID=A0A9P9FJ38_9HYPO|nr:ribonuclease H-like domain-containing protein [Dactylonectria estremocensis]
MAGLSSNWKKLQEKLKTESSSKPESSTKPSLKRKSTAPSVHPPPKKSKKVGEAKKKQTVSIKRIKPNPNRQMGGVHSNKVEDVPSDAPSTSLALWANDNDISAEALAEAYSLGTKDNSMMRASEKDRINSGLIEGIEIGKYIAIDCEMVGVGPGGHESALARVSVVDFHGRQVYDSYVKPKERVTNWRTAVSGISQKSMRFARDFEEVQQDVDKLLHDRILIGHDIKHDLEALILSHPSRDIRDTAKYPPFRKYGNGRKPALRLLAQQILSIEIQEGAHSSIEDARVTMLLFRKHKPGFDVDHANRYAPTAPGGGTRGGKAKKKRKA